MVHTDAPAVFPVDVSRIDRALVADVLVEEGAAYATWPVEMYDLVPYVGDYIKQEGRLGTAVVLLTGDDVGCGELDAGVPPAGTEGLVLVYRWWTTDAADPDWIGSYGTESAVVEGALLRAGTVGAWDDTGPWRIAPLPGALGLDTWGSPTRGEATLSLLDAHFEAESCGGAS